MHDEQEPDKFELAPELAALQRQLAQLAPTAPRIDRDQLMFDAGRAAQRATTIAGDLRVAGRAASIRAHFWPAATATMTAATILLSAMLLRHRPPQPIAHETTNSQTSAIADTADVPLDRINTPPWALQPTRGYLGVRNIALTRGIGALTTEFNNGAPDSPSPSEPATARQLLDELLPDAARHRS